MSSGISGVMSALKAEVLLADSGLFDQIKRLCADLQYDTADGKFAFDDYLVALVEAIDAIPKLELENDVAPGTETTYQIQLAQAAEQIIDECDRIFRRLNQFNGKLREAESDVNRQKAEFVAWYMLAALSLVKDLDLKLPSAEVRKLGEAEFSRLMGGLDAALIHLIEAVKIEANKVAHHKAAQKEKYEYGQDQANASWTSTLPAFGGAVSSERPDPLGVQEPDDEDVPQVVSRKPIIAVRDTLRILTPEAEIKGVFVKSGDAKPVIPVIDDGGLTKYSADSIKVLDAMEPPTKHPEAYMPTKENTPYCGMCQTPGCPWCFPVKPAKPVSPRKKLILEEDEIV